jgi:hypothetical protein
MGSEIEALAIGNCFLRKEAQDPSLRQDSRKPSNATDEADKNEIRWGGPLCPPMITSYLRCPGAAPAVS